MLEQLNKNQEKAVKNEGATLVIAGAGSGKTRVLTNRIAYLLGVKKINPKNILTVTFTNKAADDMEDKIKELVGKEKSKKLTMGTFHSIALNLLKENYSKVYFDDNFTIFDMDTSIAVIDYLLENKEKDYDIKDEDGDLAKKLFKYISQAKRNLIHPKDLGREELLNLNFNDNFAEINWRNIQSIYKDYNDELKGNNALDFTTILEEFYYLLNNYPKVLESYQNRFKYILCDEYQDTNHLQYKILKLLSAPQMNLFVVGDDAQCQPPETKVLTPEGYKSIEELNPKEDKVVSYDRRGSHVTGLTKEHGYNFEKGERYYKGKIFEIETVDGKISKATNNHKWVAKWADKFSDKNVVYLMQKGDKFRVGWCQLFDKAGKFHLGARTRLEKADKTWILKILDNKSDTYKWENIIATKYGIPQITFQPTNDEHGYLNEEVIEGVFKELDTQKLLENAKKCLSDFNQYLEYPIWSRDKAITQRGGKSIQKVQSCNIIPELMKIPVHVKGKKTEWKKIKSVNVKDYEGKVYSLNVDEHHKYISNGMITCNSIYNFRGAKIENILNFSEEFNAETIRLDKNYRSNEIIVKASNSIIEKNQQNFDKDVVANKTGNDLIKHYFADYYHNPPEKTRFSSNITTRFIGDKIEDLIRYEDFEPKDIAVLYRTNYLSREIEESLTLRGINNEVLNGTSFYDRVEIKAVIAHLRFILNPKDFFALKEINKCYANNIGVSTLNLVKMHARNKEKIAERINKERKEKEMNLFTQKEDTKKVTAQEVEQIPLIEVFRNPIDIKGIGKKRGQALINFADKLEEIKSLAKIGDVAKMIETIKKDFILEYLVKKENVENRKENIDSLKTKAEQSGNDLSSFLEETKLVSDQDDMNENDNSVKLMTVHASKGLEYKAVFLVGLEEGLFPHNFSIEAMNNETNPYAIEEERRLFYVGVTRAEEKLFICNSQQRKKYQGYQTNTPSRFLEEIPQKFLKSKTRLSERYFDIINNGGNREDIKYL